MLDTPGTTDEQRLNGIRAALREGAIDFAIGILNQWLLKEPERGDLHLLLGLGLQQDGKIAQAKASYLRASQLMPTNPEPLLYLHGIAVKEQRPLEELRLLRAILGLQPNDEKVLRR